MANRLSANPDNEVLLIEAGPKDSNPLIRIPGAYVKLFKSDVDWQFWTEPQKYLDNRRLYLPRGKTLGGSSSTNAMAYVRGHKNDYNHWSSLGNSGWDYDSVLKYFLKSEYHEQVDQMDPEYHGQQGELNVTLPRHYKTPFADAFIEAGKAIGLPFNSDYNGAHQEGIGRFQFTIRNAARHSAADAFLHPVEKRKNLTILTHAQLCKVNVEGKTTTGVELIHKKKRHFFGVNKEVILSAGAFGSPQLLMLSGIGDRGDLDPHGLTVKHDLPGVGKNLQDHLFFPVSATSNVRMGLNHGASIIGQLKGILNYYIYDKGPFTIGPLEAVAFFNTDDFKKDTNCQLHFAPMHIGSNRSPDIYDIKTFVSPQDGFTILPSLLQPKSRGTINLASANPLDAPVVDPNFLSENEDLELLIKGGKIALEILNQDAFKPFLDKMVLPEEVPQSDDQWARHIRSICETIYHPVGTCKMGNDEMAVVDDRLRVHGMEKLRVVDASVMPTICSGNTNAPVYMIAEKGADMILEDN